MNTWICKALPIALFALSACIPAPPSSKSGEAGALAPPMTSAKMMQGVSVQAPDGFCFDRNSLARQFALLARCDTLGMRGTRFDTPVAVITMTVAKNSDASLPVPEALVVEDETLLESDRRDFLQLVKIDGKPPHDGLSGRHWRGVGQIGDSLVLGLAIYPSDTSEGLDGQGPMLLQQAYARTLEGIGPTAPRDETAAGGQKNSPGKWLASLFRGNNSAR